MQPGRILTLANQNFKVYADLGLTSLSLHCVLIVSDTGVGPSFIQVNARGDSVLPHVLNGPIPDTCDVNNCALEMFRTI